MAMSTTRVQYSNVPVRCGLYRVICFDPWASNCTIKSGRRRNSSIGCGLGPLDGLVLSPFAQRDSFD